MTDRQEMRADLATATRVLGRHDMIGMFGHVSLLTEDPERYLISPGAGRRKDTCRPEHVFELGLDDEFEVGLPLELYMHAEMHRARPEIKSLIHVHSPNLTTLAGMAEPPADLLMIHAAFWPDPIPLWERPDLVRNHESGRELVELIGNSALALMRWHGAVVVGHTLQEALFRTLLAEYHAGIVLASLSHGRPLEPVSVARPELYARTLPPTTHELNWRFESSYVDLDD